MLHRTALTLSLILTFMASARASGIAWEKNELTIDAKFGDETVDGLYSFTNTSAETIKILSAKASCGCTVPTLEKTDYESGESGVLTAVFDIGSRSGLQEKRITVLTDEAGTQKEYSLTLRVNIPQAITFSPARVKIWKIGEEAGTESIEIRLHEALGITLDSVRARRESDKDLFTFEIVKGESTGMYTIHAKPVSTEKRMGGSFLIVSANDENGFLERYPFYLYVK